MMIAGTPTTGRRFVLATLMTFLFLFVQAASASNVRAQNKSEKATDGRLAIRTNKRNLMISINGQPVSPQPKNEDGIMRLIVPAGNNTIEVLLPDSNDRWEKEINVPAGRMICMRLTHHAAIVNKGDSKTDPPRAQGAEVKMVEYITAIYQECDHEDSPLDGWLVLKSIPGGYPILIDGKDYGVTDNDERSIELPLGTYKLEVLFPQHRWTRTIEIVGGRRNCICLNYLSRIIDQETVLEVSEETCECPQIVMLLPNVTKEWKTVKKIKKR
jgi:hypothetical protein